jgi:hypothetical protein
MTRKQRILGLIQRLPDDIGFKHIIYHLTVLKGVEIGVERALSGASIDDDAFFQCLLDADPHWPPLAGTSQTKTASAKQRSGASSGPSPSKAALQKGRQT